MGAGLLAVTADYSKRVVPRIYFYIYCDIYYFSFCTVFQFLYQDGTKTEKLTRFVLHVTVLVQKLK